MLRSHTSSIVTRSGGKRRSLRPLFLVGCFARTATTMNQQAGIAEAMRQGQVETERRMLATKAFLGSSGPNPLIDFFSDDRVIAELEVDAAEIRRTFFDGYFRSPFCFLPCVWPHQVLLGMPCMFLRSLGAVDDAAQAH